MLLRRFVRTWLLIIALALMGTSMGAHAACTLPPSATCEGAPCASLTRPEGHLLFNQDHNTYQVCESSVWKKIWAIGLWGCPNGYLMQDDSCYRVLSQGTDWTTARTQCQASGGDLVSINDAQEMSIVNTLRGGNGGLWVGYSDADVEGNWAWLDAGSTYANWQAGQPDGGAAENCGAVRWDTSEQVADRSCAEWNMPLCEAPRRTDTSGLVGPSGCANIGDLCPDGTVFIGYHPVTQAHLFIPPADEERPGSPGTFTMSWKNVAGTDDINPDSLTAGQENHANRSGSLADYHAFQVCESSATGGHDDWYLPSYVELYYMWSIRSVVEAGGHISNFQSTAYWASTEFSNSNAWYINFAIGNTGSNSKSGVVGRVRCIRSN